MNLIDEYTAFTRKVPEFAFVMVKKTGRDGAEVVETELRIPGFSTLSASTTACPATDMADLMAKHRKRLRDNKTVLVPMQKILIVGRR